MSSPAATPDAISKKYLAKWGREEMTRIQDSLSDTLLTQESMNSKLLEAVSQRALHFSENTSKFLVTSTFPLPSEVSSPDFPGIPEGMRIFPSHAQVREIWISFEDKSLLFLAIPTEKTRALGRFLAATRKTPGAAQAMGFRPEALTMAREIIHLSEHKRFVSPMSSPEFAEFLAKKRRHFAAIPPGFPAPLFEINANPQMLSPLAMLDALEAFSREPEEFGWSKSIGEWLESSYGASPLM